MGPWKGRERETGNGGTLYDRPDRLSTRLKSIGCFFLFARKEERNWSGGYKTGQLSAGKGGRAASNS